MLSDASSCLGEKIHLSLGNFYRCWLRSLDFVQLLLKVAVEQHPNTFTSFAALKLVPVNTCYRACVDNN
jgi:hypothetical protein